MKVTKKLAVPPAVRLGQAIDEYLRRRQRQEIAESTLRSEKSLLRRFAASVGGDPWMSQISSTHVEEFFYGDIGGLVVKNGAASFNVCRTRFGGFVKFCLVRGWIHTDLMYQVVKKTEPETRMVRLSADQLQRALEGAKWPRDRIAVAISLSTLLRASEIVELRVGHVNLDTGFMDVWKPKSKRWDRMPISADLDAELRRWLTHYTKECGPLEGNWYLCPAQWHVGWGPGGVKVNLMQLRPGDKATNPHLIVRRAFRGAGIEFDGRKGFHTIRRSMATLFLAQHLDKGVDDAMLMTSALLGHKNVSTTQIYTGYQTAREHRDKVIRGVPMLSSMVSKEHVVPLRVVKGE